MFTIEVIDKPIGSPYKIVNGRWTFGGLNYNELTPIEQAALGEHVANLYKTA